MISIPKKVEYGLVLVKFLSQNTDKNVSLSEASQKLILPYRFLCQVAAELKKGGVVESQEGKRGGYKLKRGWQGLSLYDFLKILGERKAIVTCMSDKKCSLIKSCGLRALWEDLESVWIRELEKIKLSKL